MLKARIVHLLLSCSASMLASLAAAALPLSDGALVVSGDGPVGSGLIAVDPVSGAQSLISPGDFQDFAIVDASTIYALSGNDVVAVDTHTGAQTVVSSGGLISAAAGIAASPGNGVFVLDGPTQSEPGEILRIEDSGAQSVLVSTVPQSTLRDLESLPTGDLVYLGSQSADEGVFAVDVATGGSTLLLDNSLGGQPGAELAGLTGLGVAADGDVWLSHGLFNGTTILAIDSDTGAARNAGDTTTIGTTTSELLFTDIALGGDGATWMTGAMLFGAGEGLFRMQITDTAAGPSVRPLLESDGTPFAVGSFSEVQVFSARVPEPASGLLVATGLLLAGWRSRPRPRGWPEPARRG